MVADASYDPSRRVEQAAKEAKAVLRVVAMGSAESTAYADQYLEEGLKIGTWVLMKNIHLARDYMSSVEKRLHFEQLENRVHANFRLLLTVERGPKEDPRDLESRRARRANVVPINLLESAVKIVYEAPPGLKSSLMQTYGALDQSKTQGGNNNSSSTLSPTATFMERLYLAAAWLHGVIVERLSYVPLGWCQVYEFSDTEFLRAAQAVAAWSSDASSGADNNNASGGGNAATPVVSWPALRRIVSSTIYGGKVSNPFDEHLFDILCDQILNPAVFDKDFVFLRPPPNVRKHIATFPPPLEGTKTTKEDLLKWVESLPDGSSNPQWLGLPSGVARMLLARHALETIERLTAVQIVLNEELASASGAGTPAAANTPSKRGGGGSLTASTRTISASQSLIMPGALDKAGMATARWAEKVRDYCVGWRPGLQAILDKLEKHTFVAKALAAEDVARSTELITGVENMAQSRRSISADRDGNSTSPSKSNAAPISPLELAVQRECVALVSLLRRLANDVKELEEVCGNTRKPSSTHRQLMEELTKDRVPTEWSGFLYSNTTTRTASMLLVSPWIADIQVRGEHLLALADATFSRKLAQTCVSLGLLCFPGAFLTAAKQQCAREQRAPLEQLTPHIEMMTEAELKSKAAAASPSPSGANAGTLFLTGVTLVSAQANGQGQGELVHSSSAVSELTAPVAIKWSWRSGKKASQLQNGSLAARLASQRPFQATAAIPVYVTEQRDALLEVVELPIVANGELDCWYERGVCISAWVPSE